MSSDIRWIRRCARLDAVPPPNTRRSGTGVDCDDRCQCLDYVQVFSTSAGLGNPKYAWTSNSSGTVSPLDHKFRISIAALRDKRPLTPHHRIDWNLRRPSFVVGALGLGHFPRHTELVQPLARGAGADRWSAARALAESILINIDRLPRRPILQEPISKLHD
jgi:hypothetical protein